MRGEGRSSQAAAPQPWLHAVLLLCCSGNLLVSGMMEKQVTVWSQLSQRRPATPPDLMFEGKTTCVSDQ